MSLNAILQGAQLSGTTIEGGAKYASLRSESAMARYNAKVAAGEARQQEYLSEWEQGQKDAQLHSVLAAQRTAGVTVPEAVTYQTIENAMVDKAMIQYNRKVLAGKSRNEARLYKFQAGNIRRSANLSLFGTGFKFIGQMSELGMLDQKEKEDKRTVFSGNPTTIANYA